MTMTAKKRIDSGKLRARGYRLLLKPIAVNRELEAAQLEATPTLAKAGFITKTYTESLANLVDIGMTPRQGLRLIKGEGAYLSDQVQTTD